VTVHYRFHPLAGQKLDVIHYPAPSCNWVLVRTPKGFSLKIPQWMLAPAASQIVISPFPQLSDKALTALIELVQGEACVGHSESVPKKEKGASDGTAEIYSAGRKRDLT
jgi:hypothetical protein